MVQSILYIILVILYYYSISLFSILERSVGEGMKYHNQNYDQYLNEQIVIRGEERHTRRLTD